jgi:2-keto-3-deoxy-L-rhamnonate aldolase RhmA
MTRDIKRRLAAGETLVGVVINIAHPSIIELCCGAGADFLFLDFEHGLRDFSEIANGLITAELCGVPALVRIGKRSENLAARMRDAGTAGILFSHVSTAAEAERLVSWCRYKPFGIRGSGVARAFLRHSGSEYDRRQQAKHDVVCIMIVEDLAGAKNLQAILAVDGVTGVAIGPGDLSMELGVDRWDHPKVQELLEEMSGTIRQVTGPRALLGLCLNSGEASMQMKCGANMLLLTHDVHLFRSMYVKLLSEFRDVVRRTVAP